MTDATRAAKILRKLVIAWDADQDMEFDEAMARARGLLGFKLDDCATRCSYCGCLSDFSVAGVCQDCRVFEDMEP